MCKDNWIKLDTLEKVTNFHIEGWEIQFCGEGGIWYPWKATSWIGYLEYRGRPKQPRTVTVTSECWRNKYGEVTWKNLGYVWADFRTDKWKRFPAGDITGEIEE